MNRRAPAPVQLALFGPHPVHIARRSPVTGMLICALCRVSLAVAGIWDRPGGCHSCPGLVQPAPPQSLLTAAGMPPGPAAAGKAA